MSVMNGRNRDLYSGRVACNVGFRESAKLVFTPDMRLKADDGKWADSRQTAFRHLLWHCRRYLRSAQYERLRPR
jgi:hypothetical protein